MVDTTWTNGGGDGLASNPANWSNGIDTDYNVIFDGTSTANCTFDYDGQLGTFTIGSGYSGTITQSSDMHITGYSQACGTFTGVTTKWVYLSGNFVKTSGTFSASGKVMINSNSTISGTTQVNFNTLEISSGYKLINQIQYLIPLYLTLNAGSEIDIQSSKTILLDHTSVPNLVNNGLISGAGKLYIRLAGSPNIPSLGDVDCLTHFECRGDVGSSITPKFIASSILLSTVQIDSAHATWTITLDLNGHNLTASSITIGTRGILSNSAATDSVISCASFDSSAGTFTEANTQVILNGNGTLKTGTHKFDELVQRDGVITTLASDITVTNEFDTAGSFVQGAYSITHENPEKRLIAPMVNPIIRNPKRSPFLNNRFTKNIEIEVV